MKRVRMSKMFVVAAVPLALLAPVWALADDVYVKSGTSELARKNVTVKGVENGKLVFSINQRDSSQEIDKITRLELTGESAFNAAERAFAEASAAEGERARAKYAEAVTGYQTTLGSTNKPWLKEYVSARLVVAAPRSGRFDAAIASWVAMVQKDPAAAMKAKPGLEGVEPKSTYLTQSVKTLQTALAAADRPEEKRAYLDLLGDVQNHMGDLDGAAKTAEQRVQLGGNPEEIAAVMVQLAQLDLANKRYEAAAARLGRLDLTTLPDGPRAEALYVLAECRAAAVKPGAPPEQLKDVALDYMRVVVSAPTGPQSANALLKVAQIHETLKENETAVKLYQQITKEHPNTPAAQTAQQSIERLSKTARG
jgi:TolA-binding protein